MSRRAGRLWLLAMMAAAVALAAVGLGATRPAGVRPSTAGQSSAGRQAPSSAGCADRVNDTAQKLLPCIRTADLWRQMQAFQAIADANPGPDGHPSRNSGEPGYKASVDYVAKLMRQAGYDVTIQRYTFSYFTYTAPPTFRQVSPMAHAFTVAHDWYPGQALGTTTAAIEPAGGIVLPPRPRSSSTSGCTAADFRGFGAGRIALIQRGGCTFGMKVHNAQAAGASGVIIFNEGNPHRTAATDGAFVDTHGNQMVPTIPVAFTSFAVGRQLLSQYRTAVRSATALPRVSVDTKAVDNPNADDYNVIADSKGGDPNHVLVVDAHLDAIYGAGMLDNASGSTTILDIARMMREVTPRNKVRFIWFGGEELGELGSTYYLHHLTPGELGKIKYDLDADVTATPNYVVGILDPAAPGFFGGRGHTDFPRQVYESSNVARDQAIRYFGRIGKNYLLFSPAGTDAHRFNQAGIPASGVLTGQDCCKSQAQVDLFGGSPGNYEGHLPSFDGGCVDQPFTWCDNLSNTDPQVLTFMSRGFADMVIQMAFNRSAMGWNDSLISTGG